MSIGIKGLKTELNALCTCESLVYKSLVSHSKYKEQEHYKMTAVSYWDLGLQLKDIDSTIAWCRRQGLLADNKDCPTCGTSCRQVKRARYSEGYAWRCPKKGCQKVVSLRDGSFFSNSSLSISMILRVIHLWSSKTPLNSMMKETKVCNKYAISTHS